MPEANFSFFGGDEDFRSQRCAEMVCSGVMCKIEQGLADFE